uniref:Adducin 2 n=1 Tax=Gallus gallus TaxID=9031 RepID=A0A8V0ZGR6_CHICK
MSTAASPEPPPSPPAPGPRYFERFPEDDPEYLRERNMAADLRQDFNMMEQKKRVTMILQSPSFREELESLIQEQMKKGNNSSHVWALRQIADFVATTSPAALPTSPMGLTAVTPINDLHGPDAPALAKGERLMRCKVGSVHRLLDLYGWAQLGHAAVTLRVSKEQEHFLVAPQGLACSEVTAASLIKVNVLGDVVEQGSTDFAPDARAFSLHAAIYAARPDARCIVRLHTPATAAVSAMRCGVLPISRAALLLGDIAYFDFRGEVEDEADRVELQKCLGPTCKILVLRNHGVLALGDTAEEAFYSIFHLQAACEVQVSALASAGGAENLIVLERAKHRPHEVGSVRWAGSTFGPMQKSRLGEHEFEALMRMLDNLGYRTGYTYRYPFVQEKSKPKSDVLIPATVTAFVFEEEAMPTPALRQHAQKQQKEKTRWLNTPNTYLRVSVAEEQQGGQKTKTTWLKADEVEKGSSGTAIRIENPNQFVPLYTDPQEVLEMRNKIREQNRQDVKSAGPQSQLLASVIAETSRSPVRPPCPRGPHSSSLQEVTLLFGGGAFSPQKAIWGMPRPKTHLKRRPPLSRSPRTLSASSRTRSWRSTSGRWRGRSWGCTETRRQRKPRHPPQNHHRGLQNPPTKVQPRRVRRVIRRRRMAKLRPIPPPKRSLQRWSMGRKRSRAPRRAKGGTRQAPRPTQSRMPPRRRARR